MRRPHGRQYGKRMALLLAAGAVTVLPGCQAQLEALTGAPAKGNTATSSSSFSRPAALVMPVITEPQREAIRIQLAVKLYENGMLRAREEAKDTIEKVLATSACYPHRNLDRYLQQYLDPQATLGLVPPMAAMTKHPRSQCLTVTRLDGWLMLAKNAFAFRAVYLSEASSETESVNYRMVKQPDGTWLFR